MKKAPKKKFGVTEMRILRLMCGLPKLDTLTRQTYYTVNRVIAEPVAHCDRGRCHEPKVEQLQWAILDGF